MTPRDDSVVPPATIDGFEVLDECHRQTMHALARLEALIARLADSDPDAGARAIAREVIAHFATTSRQHHEDEERHVFPVLLATGDAATVQAVQRLQQDHRWIEHDWRVLQPALDAIASGQGWVDLQELAASVRVFLELSHDHIALEESHIYPQARKRLAAGSRRDMGHEIARRHAARDARREARRETGAR